MLQIKPYIINRRIPITNRTNLYIYTEAELNVLPPMETLQGSYRVLYQAQASRNLPSFEENDAWVTNQSIEPRYPQPDRAAAVVALSSWRMVERNQGDKGGRRGAGKGGGGMAGWVASDSIFTY